MYSRVYVEIGNICNRACTFCPSLKRKRGQMPLERFKYIADELLPVTHYLYLHIMGEPDRKSVV